MPPCESRDVGITEAKIATLDMVELGSLDEDEGKVRVPRSDSGEGVVDRLRSKVPMPQKVRLMADPNSNQ